MKPLTLLAPLLLVPCLALAHHPKPEPTPPPTKPRCSCWWQDGLRVAGGITLLAVPLYLAKEKDGGQKKVDLQPTDDGKGARLVFEVRH